MGFDALLEGSQKIKRTQTRTPGGDNSSSRNTMAAQEEAMVCLGYALLPCTEGFMTLERKGGALWPVKGSKCQSVT